MGKIQVQCGTVIFGLFWTFLDFRWFNSFIGPAIYVLGKYLLSIHKSVQKSYIFQIIHVCHVLNSKNGQAILFFNLKDVQIEILTIATDFFALTNDFLQMNEHFHK